MKIIEVPQGSPEWFMARLGIPTASDFDKIIDTSGKSSKQRRKYLLQLAGERTVGRSDQSFQNWAMLRGQEKEIEARRLYEMITGEPVRQVGFCVTEEHPICGASPDGLAGDDGVLELKCPLISTHTGYLLDEELPSEYFQQVQGQLLVTGRKWCDFMSYYPGMKPMVVRVEPDAAYQEILKKELEVFCTQLDDAFQQLQLKETA